MAFVSIQNLVAPFTNKVHLTSIIAVALAFAVFRLSGGGISVETPHKPTQKQQRAPLTSTSPIAAQMELLKSPPTQPTTPSTGQITREQVFAPVKTAKPKRSAPAAYKTKSQNSQSTSTGLEDIERSLGLR